MGLTNIANTISPLLGKNFFINQQNIPVDDGLYDNIIYQLQKTLKPSIVRFVTTLMSNGNFFKDWLPENIETVGAMAVHINGDDKVLNIRQTVTVRSQNQTHPQSTWSAQFHLGLQWPDRPNRPLITAFAIYASGSASDEQAITNVFPAQEIFAALLQAHRADYFKPHMDAGLFRNIQSPELRDFFETVNQGVPTFIELAMLIFQWRRSPSCFINGKKWDQEKLIRVSHKFIGKESDQSPRLIEPKASEIFQEGLLPFFSSLGISPERANYLANAMIYDGFSGRVLAAFLALFNSKYETSFGSLNEYSPQPNYDTESISVAIAGRGSRLTLTCDACLTIPYEKQIKGWSGTKMRQEKILIPLQFVIGLCWPRPEIVVPMIESFKIGGKAEKAYLPGTKQGVANFINGMLPSAQDYAQFLEAHRIHYCQTNDYQNSFKLRLAQQKLNEIEGTNGNLMKSSLPPNYLDIRGVQTLAHIYSEYRDIGSAIPEGNTILLDVQYRAFKSDDNVSAQDYYPARRQENFKMHFDMRAGIYGQEYVGYSEIQFHTYLITEHTRLEALLMTTGLLSSLRQEWALEAEIKQLKKSLKIRD